MNTIGSFQSTPPHQIIKNTRELGTQAKGWMRVVGTVVGAARLSDKARPSLLWAKLNVRIWVRAGFACTTPFTQPRRAARPPAGKALLSVLYILISYNIQLSAHSLAADSALISYLDARNGNFRSCRARLNRRWATKIWKDYERPAGVMHLVFK